MTLASLLLWIIYSIWSIHSIYIIIKYPKALFREKTNARIEDMGEKYAKEFKDLDFREIMTLGTDIWITITFFIIIGNLALIIPWDYKVL